MAAVFFDVDGTLLRFSQSYAAVIADALSRAGLDVDADSFADAYDDAFFAAFGEFDPDPVASAATLALEACDAELEAETAADAFADALLAAERAATTVPGDVPALLDRLAADPEVRLGVLTNGVTDWQRAKLAHHGLLEPFDAFVASYAVGAHKPDPAVFDAAEAALPAEAYVFVGDSRDHDVAPARDRGWRAVHVGDGGDDFDAVLDSI